MKKKRNYILKLVLIGGIVILGLFSLSLGREVIRKRDLNKEIYSLEEEIKRLEKNKEEFSELIDYLSTEAFIEQEARLKLGLQKEGESLVIIPDNAFNIVEREGQADGKTNSMSIKNREDNSYKWWQYFFNY